ncbi:MAG: methyltransferase domain-containing protein [bacterium]|nr:methyltransferase domain-containing protein [bacterium]
MSRKRLFLLMLVAVAGIYGCVKTPMTEKPGNQSSAVAAYFDRCADEGVFDQFSPEELIVAKEILAQMNIRPGDKLAEAGCGAGRLTEMLAGLVGPEGKVFAFDISPRMVERCRQRGLPSQVEIACASAIDIPVGRGEFDAIICHNTFPHFDDKPAALREFHRVLRDDGVLWIVHSRSREWVNSLHSSIGGVLATHVLPDRAELERLLRETGFSLELLHDLPDRYLLKATRGS